VLAPDAEPVLARGVDRGSVPAPAVAPAAGYIGRAGPYPCRALIKEVKPRYTTEALQHMIQGTVVLEVIVTRDGCPSQIRVVQTLDRGLDEQAVLAVTQWRFEPGQRAGAPVDVFVTIMLDFSIR
jgi:protein TonB